MSTTNPTPMPPQPPRVTTRPPVAEDEIDLTRWFEAFRRRWRLLAVVVGSVLAAAILLWVITPRSYRATTTIKIERRPAAVMAVDELMGADNYWDAQIFYPTQYRLLESRGLAERVVRDLDLAADAEFNPPRAAMPGATPSAATAADDALVLGALGARLQDGLSIKPVRNTSLVEIGYEARDPELAARVANGVAQAYIDWGIEDRSETVGRASSFLTSQIEEIKQEIKDKEAQLQAYSRRSDIVALDPNSNVVLQRLEALNQDYTAAMSNRIDKESKYKEVTVAPAETVADAFSGGLVAKLRGDLLALEQEYAQKANTYQPEWPPMQELQAKIEKSQQHVQSVIAEMVEKARDSARSEYQTALRREQALAAELARQKSEAMQLNSAAVEYNNLRVEVSTRRALLDELLRKHSETGVANRLSGTRSSNVTVVDQALRPRGPYRPSLPRNLALGLVLGLMLGAGAVVAVELFDRSLRTPEDVERVLDLPVLGVIPDVGESQGSAYGYGSGVGRRGLRALRRGAAKATAEEDVHIELLPYDHPRMAAAESYRAIRTSLLLSTAGGLRSVVVTSAGPAEGKTSTATNLATVLAQLGHEVLLVDADLRRPRLHEVFKVSNRKGLVNQLTGTLDPVEVFLRTSVPHLYLTPAGPTPPNPSELLASKAMHDYYALATTRFDFVVFDSPPAGAVTDAAILGSLADGVILTVAAGRATRESVVHAAERLLMANARIIGVALNRFRPLGAGYDSYGYNAYGYGYGYGAENAPDATATKKPKGGVAAL